MLEIDGEGGFQRFEVFHEEFPETSSEELGEELNVAREVAGDDSLRAIEGFENGCLLYIRKKGKMSE